MDTTRRAVALWMVGPISCTCLTLPDGQIEICLIAKGVTIERTMFPDAETAASHAIEKMRAYNASLGPLTKPHSALVE
jgi:hypothetical protein